MAYARLAEAPNIKLSSSETHEDVLKLNGEGDLLTVLPVSAESAGLLPKRHGKSLVTSAADRIPCFYLGWITLYILYQFYEGFVNELD